LKNLRALPGVQKVSSVFFRNIWKNGSPSRLRVVDVDQQEFASYPFKHNAFPGRWHTFSRADGVLISEPYAYHNELQEGDVITLSTAEGEHRFQVVGIYIDYGSDQGVITMYRDIYNRYWHDARATSAALYIDRSVNAATLTDRLNTGLLQGTRFHARANREIREQSMNIFDRTFSITQVLRILTVIIAMIGIFGALMSIQLERNREFAVLRANGLTPGGLQRLVLAEGGLMGLAAGIIALPLGAVLAAVLIYVINRRSFGWTMDFMPEPRYLVSAVLLGLVAGVLAGVYPAWRMGKVQPATALRNE
jgi:putative ABC transport system permease protein